MLTRARPDFFVHDGNQPAVVAKVYYPVEPGVEAVSAGLNLITNAKQHQDG